MIQRIDRIRDNVIIRIDGINGRIDHLYRVIIRREEHEKLEVRIIKLEQDVAGIKEKILSP